MISFTPQDEVITVFVLEMYGTTCTLTLEEMKSILDVMVDTDDDSEYIISTKRMSRKSFLDLPKFEGF